jgi:hypothetical protein
MLLHRGIEKGSVVNGGIKAPDTYLSQGESTSWRWLLKVMAVSSSDVMICAEHAGTIEIEERRSETMNSFPNPLSTRR